MPETMVDWSESMTDWDVSPPSYTFGDMKLAITVEIADEIPAVTLTVSKPGEDDVTVGGEGGYSRWGQIGVYEFEPGKPTVLFSVFSGGAHCCLATTAVTLTDAGFVTADVGIIDGDAIQPGDIDGDGNPELALWDDRFNYTFAAYAFSWSPQLIYTFEDGAMVEVSREKRFADFYRDSSTKWRSPAAASPGCSALAPAISARPRCSAVRRRIRQGRGSLEGGKLTRIRLGRVQPLRQRRLLDATDTTDYPEAVYPRSPTGAIRRRIAASPKTRATN